MEIPLYKGYFFAPVNKKGFKFQPDHLSLIEDMLPDYPHKIFADKRTSYSLLLLALALDIMR